MTRPYHIVAVGTLVAVGGVFAVSATEPRLLRAANTMRVEDFGAYWVGTRVCLAGQNPYAEANLLPPQREIDPTRRDVFPLWSPPWTFAALAPLAPLDFPVARWVWRFLQVASILAAVTALWRVFGGPPDSLIRAWFAAILWYPTFQAVGLGQFSNLVLIGLVGWLAGLGAGRPLVAGVFLSLTLVKPQNLYLVGLLAIVWVLHRREWRAAAGAVVGTAVLTTVALIPNPEVFGNYLDAFKKPPAEFLPPTLGMVLREVFGREHFWLSFVPPVAGLIWLARYYARHRREWDWTERGPLVVLVSCVTSPYGWVYDQVLLLVPLTALLARAGARPNGAFRGMLCVAALTGVCLAMHGAGFREMTFAWFAPLCLGVYIVVGRR